MKPEQFYGLTKELLERQKAAFGRSITHLATAVVELRDKCDELERRAMTPGPKGDDGKNATDEQVLNAVSKYMKENPVKDGRDATSEQVAKAVEEYLKTNPIKNGKDGNDATIEQVERVVKDYFIAHPVRAGKDADPIDIRDVVRELMTAPEVKTVADLSAAEAVSEYFKHNPPPKGDPGDPGEDGRGLTGFLINRDGELIATTNKGEVLNLGRIVGKDGEDGNDGVSYEGHSVTYDPVTHEGVIRTLSGLETRFPLPGIVGKGYWREGHRAKAGDAWTHDGTLWIAKCDTSAKPETGSDDWFIGARKGRDAK